MADTPTIDYARLLGDIELFAKIDRLALAQLAAYLEPAGYVAGDVVFRQGEVADALYVVQGNFGVLSDGADGQSETRLNTLQAGDCFGEMGLITDEPRSATVRADTAGELLRLDRDRFLELHRREPSVARAVTTVLTCRLRSADAERVAADQVAQRAVAQALEGLPEAMRRAVLQA